MLYDLEQSVSSFNVTKTQRDDAKKYYREATAICVEDAEVLVIKRRQICDELRKFRLVGKYMQEIAIEKKKYHKILINSVLNRYRDPVEAKKLIAARMIDSITTHMSLKQSLKKNKERAKVIKEMPASSRPLVGSGQVMNMSEEDDWDESQEEEELD